MKNRYTAGFLGLFLVSCMVTKAQEPIPVKQHITDKPFLFSQLPDQSDCISEELIISKLTNYSGASFNISLNTESGLINKISGRIIHPQFADVLILTEVHSPYYLKKQLQKFFMTE
jgi:nucleoid-associated protein YejK